MHCTMSLSKGSETSWALRSASHLARRTHSGGEKMVQLQRPENRESTCTSNQNDTTIITTTPINTTCQSASSWCFCGWGSQTL